MAKGLDIPSERTIYRIAMIQYPLWYGDILFQGKLPTSIDNSPKAGGGFLRIQFEKVRK